MYQQQYDKGFADGVKAERAELFAEIEQELTETLERKTKARNKFEEVAGMYDGTCRYLTGEINALRCILYWLAEQKDKYGVTGEQKQ